MIAALRREIARRIKMRSATIAALVSVAVLGGCAHGMGRQTMSDEEMLRHCQMMEQHQVGDAHEAAEHDGAQHSGMSHEEMMQHCAELRARHDGEEPAAAHPH